jgi:peptide/nickel transport system substrate-binding protein
MRGSPRILPAPELPTERRLALIIATTTYLDDSLSQLRAPARDAVDLNEVLSDPAIGGFDVSTVIDGTAHEVRVAIDSFLADCSGDDLLLLYLSCHGLVDARRRLYFAATDTMKRLLAATGVESKWLLDRLEECRARRQVVIFDCCFSGAFAGGSKGGDELRLDERLHAESRGRVVLTASRATEYSFEGEPVAGSEVSSSVFTRCLIDGLRTGDADRGNDGYVSVDEAYAYVFEQLRLQGANQTPQRWLSGGEGEIILARSPAGITVASVSLPDALRDALDSPYPNVRHGAVIALGDWLQGPDPAKALTAAEVLQEVAGTDIPLVSAAAHGLLEVAPDILRAMPSATPNAGLTAGQENDGPSNRTTKQTRTGGWKLGLRFRHAGSFVVLVAVLVVVLVIYLSVRVLPGPDGAGGTGQAHGQIIFAESTDDPENLFPLITAGNLTSVANMEIRVLPRPFRVWPDLSYHPDMDFLAVEPETGTVEGKFKVTYQINDKAVWSDGTAMSWKDFEYTWRIQRSLDPNDGGCDAVVSSTGFDLIEAVTRGDTDRMAVVTYTQPFVDWQSVFLPVFPAHLMDQKDPVKNCDYIKKGWPTQQGIPNDISGGPWMLEAKNINNSQKTYVLTPNPKWWGAGTGLTRLIYKNLGNDASVLKALQADEVQVIYPQPQIDLVVQARAMRPKVTSNTTFGLAFEHLDMNTRNPDLANVAVRKAIALALDRKDLVQRTVGLFDNQAAVLNNRFYVTNQPAYRDNSGGSYNTPDITGAQKLLDDAGYVKGVDGIYAKSGHRLSLEIMTTVNNKLRENAIDIMTAQLKKAGIEIRKSLNENIFADAKTDKHSLAGGKFDMAMYAWVSSPTVSGNVPIYQSVENGATQLNYVYGNDPKVDSLLARMVVTTDPVAAVTVANQADAQLWQDMFTLPLYQKPTFIAFSTAYKPYNTDTGKGVGDNASWDGPCWNSDTWSLKS